ncbi:MAG: ABC transporter permease [Solirubrobacterales bacterium]|nr:ABC transporter permease [Solirubrobacterales bacterium]MBV9717054.1 ABC transporter permease [Solirubrobacterales bacterium]
MTRFIAKRLGLGLITLWLLSVLVFFGSQVLPGDVARRVLGPFATQSAVNSLNHQLGTDKSVFVQYANWISGIFHGNLGTSVATRSSVSSIVFPALWHSAKLAILAFIIVVPFGIIGGVFAALKEGRFQDRLISVGGLSATTVPEFVWAVALILLFALLIPILPSTATPPPGSGFLTSVKFLILPALCLVFVLFGYIARMARAGTIEALDADYTRTAVIKGLPYSTVVRRHVLRNALLPTIAVVATQAGYLIGGLVAIELVFNYQGIGQVLYRAASQKDFPVLQSGVLIVGVVYLVATLLADLAYSLLNPRLRFESSA